MSISELVTSPTHPFREVSDGWQKPLYPENLSLSRPQQPFNFLIFPCSPLHSTKYPQPCTSLSWQRSPQSWNLCEGGTSPAQSNPICEILSSRSPIVLGTSWSLGPNIWQDRGGLILVHHVRGPCPWSSDHMHLDRSSWWWGFMVDRK